MDLVVRIAGAAGQGVQTLGDILARSLFRRGLYVHGELSYHSRIRGGENAFTLRIGDAPVAAPARDADLLLALNEEMFDLYRSHLRAGGRVVADEGVKDDVVTSVPAVRLAREEDAPHRRASGRGGGDRCWLSVPLLLPHDPGDAGHGVPRPLRGGVRDRRRAGRG